MIKRTLSIGATGAVDAVIGCKVTLQPLYVGRMTDRSWQNFERTIIPA